jgi:hypothetical protein
MHKSIITLFFAVTAVVAIPATVQKRDPSDKSGKSTMAFACDDTTLPNPGGDQGQGEGGGGIFSTNMQFTDASGQKISPKACTAKDDFCGNCLIEGGGLSSPTNVTGCTNPAAGACSIEFNYKGYDYNSEKGQPKCGHQNSGVEAFSDTKTAICYFDV